MRWVSRSTLPVVMLAVMMVASPQIGGLCAVFGLYISWSWDLPTGATIVLILAAVFILAWIISPSRGLLGRGLGSAPIGKEAAQTERV